MTGIEKIKFLQRKLNEEQKEKECFIKKMDGLSVEHARELRLQEKMYNEYIERLEDKNRQAQETISMLSKKMKHLFHNYYLIKLD